MQGYKQLNLLEKEEISITAATIKIFGEAERNNMATNVIFGALSNNEKYHLHFLADSPSNKLSPSKAAIHVASEIGLELKNLEDVFKENLEKKNVLLGIHKTESGKGMEQYNRAAYIPYGNVVIYLVKWKKSKTALCIIPTSELNSELSGIKIDDYGLSVRQEELTKPLTVCMEDISRSYFNKVESDKFYDAL